MSRDQEGSRTRAKPDARARVIALTVGAGLLALAYVNWTWEESIHRALSSRPWVGASMVLFGGGLWVWLIWFELTKFTKRRREARRRHAGLCPACGYSLTGNASGVCPECGTGKA